MKITVFTSNQPRHLSLIRKLASISSVTYAVLECKTVFPGQVQDHFKKSEVMRTYFENVIKAEKELYGDISFSKSNVRTLSLKSGGDLKKLDRQQLSEALNSDIYVVFGASFIREWLIDYLVSNFAINIHMGISPYYRGSSCNFWALYDERPEYVGSTIHMLSKGLDSGPILYHALPTFRNENPFLFTMKAVEAAQQSLVERIATKKIFDFPPQEQNKLLEIRYTRNADFTDDIAAEYLARKVDADRIASLLSHSTKPILVNPFYL